MPFLAVSSSLSPAQSSEFVVGTSVNDLGKSFFIPDPARYTDNSVVLAIPQIDISVAFRGQIN